MTPTRQKNTVMMWSAFSWTQVRAKRETTNEDTDERRKKKRDQAHVSTNW